MKVAYIFNSTNVHKILDKMIIPQLEQGNHVDEVLGMFFFMDNRPSYNFIDNSEFKNCLSLCIIWGGFYCAIKK